MNGEITGLSEVQHRDSNGMVRWSSKARGTESLIKGLSMKWIWCCSSVSEKSEVKQIHGGISLYYIVNQVFQNHQTLKKTTEVLFPI